LGNQVGKGTGNAIATIAGAVAGGYAGHQVEKNVRTSTQYQIAIRMDDGSRRVLTRHEAPSWRQGDRVEVGPDGELSAAPPVSGGRSSF
jgi:outer membrane lipoprotein SlyB